MKITTIKPTSPSDFSNVMQLHNQVFKHFSDGTEYTNEFAHNKIKDAKDAAIFEVQEDGKLVGFAIGYERYPKSYHIWQLGVDENARGKGVASLLYETIENFAQKKGYEGVTLNTFNKFPDNLRLAIKRGYTIYDLEKTEGNDPKINMKLEFTTKLS